MVRGATGFWWSMISTAINSSSTTRTRLPTDCDFVSLAVTGSANTSSPISLQRCVFFDSKIFRNAIGSGHDPNDCRAWLPLAAGAGAAAGAAQCHYGSEWKREIECLSFAAVAGGCGSECGGGVAGARRGPAI